jgi:hypothetical protein
LVRTAKRIAVLAVSALALTGSASAATSPGGWDHLGTGATPSVAALNGRVDVLAGGLPGLLLAGGAFTSAGGDATASHIAAWNGSTWHGIGAPALNGDVHAIAVAGGKIYVGGTFTNAGGDPSADFLAAWDGASWKPFCEPITASVAALQVIGSKLYIGGTFADGAGDTTADKLVACDIGTGAESSTVDTDGDINGSVNALTADSAGRLYAGGTFINMDQIAPADHVAMYDGSWHAMGTIGPSPGGGAIDGIVRSLASDGSDVFVGADPVDIANIPTADHVARWDGATWHALGANTALTDGWFPASTFINAMVVVGSQLYVAGSFQNADGNPTADMVASFNGTAWAPMGSDGAGNGPLGGPANALATFGGQTVVGGNFTTAGGDPLAGYVARYPGISIPPTVNASVFSTGFTKYVVSGDWTSHDADGSVVAYRWVWGDGTADTTGSTDQGHVEHAYADPGTYHLQLIVTDDEGQQTTFAHDVVLRVGPKSAFTWSPQRPMVGETVAFHGAATDVDGTIVGYNWFLDPIPLGSGAGTNLLNVGPSPTHAFTKPGDVRVNMVSYECDPATCFGADSNIQTLTVIPAVIPKVTQATLTNDTFVVGTDPTPVHGKTARGTSFKFGLKAPAKVTIEIANAGGKGKLAGKLTRSDLQPGPNKVAFSGRIGKRALKPGAYTATITGRNGTGKSKPAVVAFTVLHN